MFPLNSVRTAPRGVRAATWLVGGGEPIAELGAPDVDPAQFLGGATPTSHTDPDPCPLGEMPHIPDFDQLRDPFPDRDDEGGEECIEQSSEWDRRVEQCEHFLPEERCPYYNFPEEAAGGWDIGLPFNSPAADLGKQDDADDFSSKDFTEDQKRGLSCGWALARQLGNGILEWSMCMAFDEPDTDRERGACLSDALGSMQVQGKDIFGMGTTTYDVAITPVNTTGGKTENQEAIAFTNPHPWNPNRTGEIGFNVESKWISALDRGMSQDVNCVDDEHKCACIDTAAILAHELMHWCGEKHKKGGLFGLGEEPHCDEFDQFANMVRWWAANGLPAGPRSPRRCCDWYANDDMLNVSWDDTLHTSCGEYLDGIAGCQVDNISNDAGSFLGNSEPGPMRSAAREAGDDAESVVDVAETTDWLNGW